MAIKRYFATKDNTITSAFKSNLSTRGTGSNMGLSDVLEVFSIYGQASSSSGLSSELARTLIEFDTTAIAADRTAGNVPASGNVSFFLKMYNAKHGQTLPKNYTMEIKAITGSYGTREWEEGRGLDMEGYTDATVGGTGSSWANAKATVAAATLVDAIDITGHDNGDKFTMTVPPSAGGDGVTYTFLLDSTTNVNSDTGANTFGISRQIPVDDGATRDAIIAAINGVANAAVKYGNADTGEGSTLAAGTIGLTAAAGTSSSKITLTMSTNGPAGNVPNVLAAVTGFENALLLESAFTGGSGPWQTQGGDYVNPDTDLSSSFTQSFDTGVEDLEVNITTLVEQWISSSANSKTAVNMGSKNNYGLGVMLSSSHETESRSYYTKKFFSRSSEFFFKRPVLEARWDSRDLDNRGNFIYSSSLATGDENLNKIYLYNYFRGQLRNIPGIGTGNIYVSLFSGSADDTAPSGSALDLVVDGDHVTAAARKKVVTGSYSSTGIYTASVALTAASTPLATVYDVWFQGGNTIADAAGAPVQYHTGSITPSKIDSYEIAPSDRYVTNITNLKSVYSTSETARFRVFVRSKDWCPTVYSVASKAAENTEIESGSYKIFRVIDELDVVPYGTGSNLHTAMSYDMSGNYFDLDMSMLQEGYMYGIKFTYYNNSIGDWIEQPEVFKFRVEK